MDATRSHLRRGTLVVLAALFGVTGAACAGKGSNVPETKLSCSSPIDYQPGKFEGGVAVLGFGSASAKSEVTALRQIDKATEQYLAQWKSLCDELNGGVIDKDTYATRSENLRRRLAKVPELYDGVKNASADAERRKLLAAGYDAIVPEGERLELSLELAVIAAKGAAPPRAVAAGEKLSTGTNVTFVVSTSKAAHVYLFQKGPDGALQVLFPNPKIAIKNPVAAHAQVKVPPPPASFVLNSKDIGIERVYVVASLAPLNDIEGTLSRAAEPASAGALASLNRLDQPAPSDCKTRSFDLDLGTPPPTCVRARGFDFDAGAGAPAVSLRARTEAADSVIAQVFAFEHTP